MTSKTNFNDNRQDIDDIVSYITKINTATESWTHKAQKIAAKVLSLGSPKSNLKQENTLRTEFTVSHQIRVDSLRIYPEKKSLCEKLLQILKSSGIDINEPSLPIDKINMQPVDEFEELNIADSLNNLGSTCYFQGRYDEAIKFHGLALKIKEKVLGKDHFLVAESLNNLGVAFNNQKQYDKAIQFHNEALKIRLLLIEQDPLSVAASYNNLGTVYHLLGQNEKAIEFCQKAREIGEKSGNKGIIVADFFNNLGIIHHVQGKSKEAIEFFQQALEISKNILGENHPLTIEARNNIDTCRKKSTDLIEK